LRWSLLKETANTRSVRGAQLKSAKLQGEVVELERGEVR